MESTKAAQITGPYARGSFSTLQIPDGRRYFVNAHFVVGFSDGFKSLHTHIKFRPIFFALRKHFFQVFEGPGTVLLYGPASFDSTESLDHQPRRIVAFDIHRRFTAIPPTPSTTASQVINVFSREVIWRFADNGITLVENRSEQDAAAHEPHTIWSFVKHVLGFFRI